MSSKLAILGAGELGIQILDLIRFTQESYTPVGFFDDTKPPGSLIQGIKVLGKINDVRSFFEKKIFDSIVLAIGYNHMAFREKLFSDLMQYVPFATLIHSTCVVHPDSFVGQGSVVYPGCIVDKGALIGHNVLLNLGATIAHDSVIGAHSFLAPRVVISGFVNIGNRCFLGSNSTIINNISVGEDVVVGAGSVVIRDVPGHCTIAGNPARMLASD